MSDNQPRIIYSISISADPVLFCEKCKKDCCKGAVIGHDDRFNDIILCLACVEQFACMLGLLPND